MLVADGLKQLPAYQELARAAAMAVAAPLCLQRASVAVPFVSAVAGALVITQAIRIASGYAHHVGITGDLRDLASIRGTLGGSFRTSHGSKHIGGRLNCGDDSLRRTIHDCRTKVPVGTGCCKGRISTAQSK